MINFVVSKKKCIFAEKCEQYEISYRNPDFRQIIDGGYVYVDKTDLIYQLVQGNIYFLGRPRRFGKSL